MLYSLLRRPFSAAADEFKLSCNIDLLQNHKPRASVLELRRVCSWLGCKSKNFTTKHYVFILVRLMVTDLPEISNPPMEALLHPEPHGSMF